VFLCRFHPPEPPYYDFDYDILTDTYSFALADEIPTIPFDDYTVHVIPTKHNTCVPVILLRHPEAKYTIIYSHGNATDIGAMYLIYVMMATSLKVNIVGYDYSGYGVSNAINGKVIESKTSINGPTAWKPYKAVNPTEQQTYKDIEAVYNWCVDINLVSNPSQQIILYGQSVGRYLTHFEVA
jgi:hypothetical protein